MFELTAPNPPPAELTVGTLIRAIKARWYLPAGTVVVAVIAALIYLNIATPTYRATMVVSPIFSDDGSSGGGGLGRYADLASSVGIDIGGSGSLTYFSLFMETLQSYELAESLAQNENLLPALYPALWDKKQKTWRDADTVRSKPARWVRALLNRPTTPDPNTADLHQYLRQRLTIDDPPTPFKTIGFENQDPEFARVFLQSVYRTADDMVRARVRQRASVEVRFLESLVAESRVVEHRRALSDLLAQKQRTLMMSNMNLPFSAQLMQPPIPGNTPASPRPLLVLTMSIFFGLVAGLFLVLMFPSPRLNAETEIANV
jgi:LPS O-antigen subunit length determinant protein (WzzB/FepE family)|tara:strand:- start:3311 stop:4261 length:951 start_codon:yes stop_codon:yes gene_type:complete